MSHELDRFSLGEQALADRLHSRLDNAAKRALQRRALHRRALHRRYLSSAFAAAIACSAAVANAQSAGDPAIRVSPPTETLAQHIHESGDNHRLPFLIVDKVAASVAAYDSRGRLQGVAPALLGAARGDHSVPGIGERPIAKILPHERTTPAGRFVAEFGRNTQGEEIIWIDYEHAVSMHRVRATNPAERRLQRLASPTPSDNRISYGCINIPVRYFDDVVKPLMSGGKAVAYVLPEVRHTQDVFAFARAVPVTRTRTDDQNGNRAKRPG